MNKDKIIVALDVAAAAEARQIVADLRGEVGAFKIGLQLFTAAGASFVRETVESGIKVFLDLKFHDIPNTAARASVEAARLGVWMFNVHALGGAEMMRATIENVREVCERENLIQPKIIGVTVLTSANRETLREVGIAAEPDEQVLRLAQLAAKCGLHGVVASPREIKMIRANVGEKNFLIVTPGIRNDAETKKDGRKTKDERRNKLETSDDQKRVMSAKEAIAAGADYLVIGRPILQSADRISAVRKILREVETA
ncbi:MAG: orotidine-5'-phosphate decarboxylase [Pyrinomonadaceae bacterium]|nr:orotidine-5'-phosphate decarboxylase [Pyrinomonadaceae bacterium]